MWKVRATPPERGSAGHPCCSRHVAPLRTHPDLPRCPAHADARAARPTGPLGFNSEYHLCLANVSDDGLVAGWVQQLLPAVSVSVSSELSTDWTAPFSAKGGVVTHQQVLR